MGHLLETIIGGLIFLALGLGILAHYSKKKDPTETDEGKVINFDDPADRVGEDNYPSWKKAQEN